MASKQIPVYLFVGMLESGKTKFIQETMEDEQFDSGDKTLLLICEDGEEEYDPDRFAFGGVTVEYLNDKSELNVQNLTRLAAKSGCGRVIIEYNGMWLIQDLADALPANWVIYQCLATADGTTIKTYAGDNAMRSLLLDKLRTSELLVVNRAEAVNDDESRQLVHKLVRQASRRCDIAYEFKDGSVAYDDIPDPLPFDVNAPVIEIPPEFFGIWYMDCMDEPDKYNGKTVKFLAQVCQTSRAGKDSFVPGRFAMTCCVQDIQFVGFPCKYDAYKTLKQRDWITLTAKVGVKFHPIYKGQTPDSTGPVLTAVSVEPAEKPVEDVVMFS
ncbi:outer membrane insertion C- signal [Gemmiger formicilis]|uniref:TIGR03943 family putative permease subunit n=1 Tax=Gemmiger formicilis TaxID=745368 RepID=UPI0019599E7C|nr:outer membrane insertion C- signal [Gemmiger formicilis]MBM6715378.1 outer membrane insertion C- signal [Gemmiger formicilis]